MSTLAKRIASAIADPIDIGDDYPFDDPWNERFVIGVRPADLDELLALAGIELDR